MQAQGVLIGILVGLTGYVLLRNLLFVILQHLSRPAPSFEQAQVLGASFSQYALRRLLLSIYKLLALTFIIFLLQYSPRLPHILGWCPVGSLPPTPPSPPPLYWDSEKTLWLISGVALLAAVIGLSRWGNSLWERYLLRSKLGS